MKLGPQEQTTFRSEKTAKLRFVNKTAKMISCEVTQEGFSNTVTIDRDCTKDYSIVKKSECVVKNKETGKESFIDVELVIQV